MGDNILADMRGKSNDQFQSADHAFTSDNYKKILKSKDHLRNRMKEKIVLPQPMIERGDFGVIYSNTINVIQGKSGVHKSRLVEVICSSLLTKNIDTEFLGFKSMPYEKTNVLYVDTERNQNHQFPLALQSIKLRAGYSLEFELEAFDFFSLIEIPRTDRFNALKEYINITREDCTTQIVIVLDVITDCVSNFNDPTESLKLIDFMNEMINKRNVTFICLIHENPGSGDKARGHIGTEIMNKASTVIQIGFEKESDLIKIGYLKCRNSKRLDTFYVVYSEVEKGLVLADQDVIQTSLDANKSKATIPQITKSLAELVKSPIEKFLLFQELKKEFSCTDRTIETRIKEIIEERREIVNSEGRRYYLEKGKKARKTLFSLIPREPKLI